jgi:hypothetical protein
MFCRMDVAQCTAVLSLMASDACYCCVLVTLLSQSKALQGRGAQQDSITKMSRPAKTQPLRLPALCAMSRFRIMTKACEQVAGD